MSPVVALTIFVFILVTGCADNEPVMTDKIEVIIKSPQSEKRLTNSLWSTTDETNQIRILQLDSTIKGWQVLHSAKANCQCIFYLPLNKTQGEVEYSNREKAYSCSLLPRSEILQIPIQEIERCKMQPQFSHFTFIAGVFTLKNPVKDINQIFY